LLSAALMAGPAGAQLTDGQCTAPIDAAAFEDLLLNEVGLDVVPTHALQAPLVSTSPVADGIIGPGEYPNMCWYSFADHENPGNPYPGGYDNIGPLGDEDLNMTMYLAHTDQALFLGFTIKDEFLDLDDAVYPFYNDGVELFVNPDLDLGDAWGPGKFQIDVDAAGGGDLDLNNRFTNGGPQWITEPGPEAGEYYSAGLVLADESGYVIEYEIPLGSLDKDGAAYPADNPVTTGDVILFNVAVDDNDAPENLAAQNGHHILWQVEGAGSPYGGGENIWIVPLSLTDAIVSVPGDFNGSGALDSADIDDLTGQSAGGLNPAAYDLNSDALVNEGDVNVWIKDLFNSWVGDADLNGVFDSSDLVAVLASGAYEADVASVWSTGDFNGDGRTNSTDLVAALADGGYELGPRAAVAAVPEPGSLLLLVLGGLACIVRRRL
jgi:hypothetical protein